MKKLLTLIFVFALTGFFAQNKTVVENVDAAAFKKYVDNKSGVLIDLRTTDEIVKEGKIKGAIQIDFLGKDAEEKIAALDHNKTYMIYCAGGGRSGQCVELMEKQGFSKVIHLQKGFSDWKKQNFPIDKSTK